MEKTEKNELATLILDQHFTIIEMRARLLESILKEFIIHELKKFR